MAAAVRIAERVLSARAGITVTLADPVDLGGSGRTEVVRVRAPQNPISQDRSLVIKVLPSSDDLPGAAQTRESAAGRAYDDLSFARELASYKYATALPIASRPGPHLIAYDAAERVIVLSDLGTGRSMTDLLGSADRSATEHAVSAWGQALGRMHAATLGGEGDFAALLRQNSGRDTTDVLAHQARSAVDVCGQVFDEYLSSAAPQVIVDLLDEACALFTDGDHRAFSPSDVGPENIMINADGVQFMDYEWGGFRDPSLDVAYALVTLGPHLSSARAVDRGDLEAALIEAWRSEVRAIWPALQRDAELHRRVLTARAIWVWLSTVWMLPVETPGTGESATDAAATADQLAEETMSHGLALHTTSARQVVGRWRDLREAAILAGRADVAAHADDVAGALESAWLR